MAFQDPDIQHGLLGAITALLAGIWWWIKRRIGLVDDLRDRVIMLEKNKVSHETLNQHITNLETTFSRGHEEILDRLDKTSDRMDALYRDMIRRNEKQ